MNEPTVQIALPAFSRSMKTLSVLLGGLWIVAALVSRAPDPGSAPDPMGPFTALVLIPSRVAHGEVWRLITHPLLHDPASIQSLIMTVLTLWFFGGAMEARWGLRRLLTTMAVASVVSALVVIAVGAVFTPFWTQRAYGPRRGDGDARRGLGHVRRRAPTSFIGVVDAHRAAVRGALRRCSSASASSWRAAPRRCSRWSGCWSARCWATCPPGGRRAPARTAAPSSG